MINDLCDSRKVNFVCVGAQKAGTTALNQYLKQHPQIEMPSTRKELHFFDNDKLFDGDVNYDFYHQNFKESSVEKKWGEVTPIYMYWPESIKRIWQYNSDIKLIVILRNPIERAYSHWNMETSKNKDTLCFSEAIRTEHERSREALPKKHRVYSYVDRGLYCEQIRRIWSFFSKSQVLFLKHEDLLNAPLEAMNKVFNFLDVDELSNIEMQKVHEIPYKDDMSEDDFLYLKDIYKYEIKELENMLSWDCSSWQGNYSNGSQIEEKKKSEIFLKNKDSRNVPVIFILSWNRPIYLWVCLDSIFRHTREPCKVIIADNSSDDPLVKTVIDGFEKRGMFYAVHLCRDNDSFRLKQLVDTYWNDIDDTFVFMESDIEILPIEGSCWLTKFSTYMLDDSNLGIVGSRVYQADFVDKDDAVTLFPDISEKEINFLIKSKAPMRSYKPMKEALISPHNPPLRLMMLRKSVYDEVGFGRDVEIHKKTVALGYKSRISTEVVHRHLSLLNMYDYMDYSGSHRDAFFDQQLPNKKNANKSKVVIILGMHRSGTSCLAGSLESYGLYLGKVKKSSPFNKKGNRENQSIFSFHEKILNDNGGSWNNPPSKIEWMESYAEHLNFLVEQYKDHSLWGFKDPRSLFFVEKWLGIFDSKFEFELVGSYRNPLSVALSLKKRNDMPIEKGLELWFKYNSELSRLCDLFQIDLIDFDLSQKQYLESVKEIATNIGLDISETEQVFYEPKLVTVDSNHECDSKLPEKIIKLHEKLKKQNVR